jgi:hypothetical protein
MILANISREIPPIGALFAEFLFDRTERFVDAAWPTLSLVYKLLSSVVVSAHVQQTSLAPHFGQEQIAKLFLCIASPDSRERRQVKAALFAIAGRLQERASMIIDLISNALVDAMTGEPMLQGLAQLLELFMSFAQSLPGLTGCGFESILFHRIMLRHLGTEYQLYSVQLVLFLLRRDDYGADRVVRYLLNHFPCGSQRKHRLFLDELGTVISSFWQALSPATAHVSLVGISVRGDRREGARTHVHRRVRLPAQAVLHSVRTPPHPEGKRGRQGPLE